MHQFSYFSHHWSWLYTRWNYLASSSIRAALLLLRPRATHIFHAYSLICESKLTHSAIHTLTNTHTLTDPFICADISIDFTFLHLVLFIFCGHGIAFQFDARDNETHDLRLNMSKNLSRELMRKLSISNEEIKITINYDVINYFIDCYFSSWINNEINGLWTEAVFLSARNSWRIMSRPLLIIDSFFKFQSFRFRLRLGCVAVRETKLNVRRAIKVKRIHNSCEYGCF